MLDFDGRKFRCFGCGERFSHSDGNHHCKPEKVSARDARMKSDAIGPMEREPSFRSRLSLGFAMMAESFGAK